MGQFIFIFMIMIIVCFIINFISLVATGIINLIYKLLEKKSFFFTKNAIPFHIFLKQTSNDWAKLIKMKIEF